MLVHTETESLVYIRTTFEGLHRWASAPSQVAFLRDWHRHVFHVKVAFKVTAHDREIEFFTIKEMLDNYLGQEYKGKKFEYSCEHLAEQILISFRRRKAVEVEVSEDGENGAIVRYVGLKEIPEPRVKEMPLI